MIAATRPTLNPASPPGCPQPQMTSSTCAGSSSGTLSSTGADDERGEVVGPAVDQRSLVRAADGCAGGGDDDGFGHGWLLEQKRDSERNGSGHRRACRRGETSFRAVAHPIGAEHHRSRRAPWLRAAVLGANDGILSTAALVVGVAAAGSGRTEILIAGLAAIVAGALSMAVGEYVSVSSQRDAEEADLVIEAAALEGPAARRAPRAHAHLRGARRRTRARAPRRRTAHGQGRVGRARA